MKEMVTLIPANNFWNEVKAGAFVTVYAKLPAISENVYCCMSNGSYEQKNLFLENVKESSLICLEKDDRIKQWSLLKKEKDLTLFEVTALVPRHLWIHRQSIWDLQQSRNRAICVVTQSSQAVYLPEVWNETQWTAQELVEHLTRKAGLGHLVAIYEIPCISWNSFFSFNNGQDHGFYAAIILNRAWDFYTFIKRDHQLGYIMTAQNEVQMDNDGAFVRSFSDIESYFKLAQLQNVNLEQQVYPVVHYALLKFPHYQTSVAAARVSFLKTTAPDFLTQDIILELVEQFDQSNDWVFEIPQVVMAMAAVTLFEEPFLKRMETFSLATDYLKAAMVSHGAFAANWILQAFASIRAHGFSNGIIVTQAQEQCLDQILTDPKESSITVQACALHGLLVFDFSKYQKQAFFLVEYWATMQWTWYKEAHGGFRYHVDEAWYRTDVTSHIVQVCFLLYNHGRSRDPIVSIKQHQRKLKSLGLGLQS